MRKVIKRIFTVAIAIAMTVAMCLTCFAGTWESYFGQNSNWYEGSKGTMSQSTGNSFTMNIEQLGWGGIWGCQAHKDVSVKKGQKYTLSFKMQSSLIEKWVFFKVTDDNDTAVYSDWIHLVPGVPYNYKATFKASTSAKYIYFGMGGEFGDRDDQAEIYALLDTLPNDVDSTYYTDVKMTNFKLAKTKAKLKITKKAKTNATALYNYLKKNGKIVKITDGYTCVLEKSGNKIRMEAIKDQQKVFDIKVSKSKPASALKKIRKSNVRQAANALNKTLKVETKMTLKKLGY